MPHQLQQPQYQRMEDLHQQLPQQLMRQQQQPRLHLVTMMMETEMIHHHHHQLLPHLAKTKMTNR
jgi:hypothetical protein